MAINRFVNVTNVLKKCIHWPMKVHGLKLFSQKYDALNLMMDNVKGKCALISKTALLEKSFICHIIKKITD